MTNLPPIVVSRENTPGEHIDYLLECLGQLEGGRGLDASLVMAWVSSTQGIDMVPVLARVLGQAALVLYRRHQPPLGDCVDDLIRRLEEAEAGAKDRDSRRKTTRAINDWERDMRKRRITHPDVVEILRKAALVSRRHFKKPV